MVYRHSEDLEPQPAVDEPFLKYQDEIGTMKDLSSRISLLKRLVYFASIMAVIFFVGCIALFVRMQNMEIKFKDEVYSPARDIIRYKNIVFTSGLGGERTAFQGPPTPERDALWEDLYGFGISRIPRASAAHLVNRTVPIPNDEGYYVVELNVFHQLHCLNMLRKRLYSKEEYAPDDDLMGIEHLEHCYDALRQSLMCMADVTPLPWQWIETDQMSKEIARVAHTCRDFDAIRDWAQDREIRHFDRSIYVPDPLYIVT